MKKYVDRDKLQEFTTKLVGKLKTMFSSPLVASTVAEMTDESKIYVYVGSESGYTAGDWYYYDGSDWVSGGVYNAIAVETDKTLLVANQAADSKAAGDAIRSVQSGLTTETTRAQAEEARIEALFVTPTQEAVNKWLDEHPEATTTVEDESLTYKKLVKGTLGYVTPEMYGAKGDGVTDDTLAISQSLNAGFPVSLNKDSIYLVSSTITAYNDSIIGNGATIKLANDIGFIINSNYLTKVKGLKFDCDEHGVESCIRINKNDNIVVDDIVIENVKDLRSDKGSNLIIVANAKNVNIENVTIKNCKHLINGVLTEAGGNITGIFVKNWINLCAIKDCSFIDIYNVDENDVVTLEDGGGIYVDSSYTEASCAISNIYGNNYCKRLIKSQCYNIVIDNVFAYSNASDMLSAIGIDNYNSGNDDTTATITNCIIVNDNTEKVSRYCITTRGKTTISNCVLKGRGYATIYCGTNCDLVVSNCEMVGGLEFKGLKAKVSNCIISGQYLNYSFTNDENSELSFIDCIYSYENGIIPNQSLLFTSNAKLNKLLNCTFNNVRSFRFTNKSIIENCVFNITAIETIAIENQATVKMKNCEINGITSLGRAINVKSGSSLDVDGLETTNCTYSIIGSGALSVKGTPLGRLLASSMTSFSNYPEYRNTAPGTSNLKDGAFYLNSNDGKLYKLTSGSWQAVN